uniref:RNA-directed DNA polymerase n=1 Tax=Geobacter sp. (strain M21) TaxID=443144 RepID=C6E134_GEOSM
MTRWSPHELIDIGRSKGYKDDYLASLAETGEAIDEKSVPIIFTLAHLAHCSNTLYSDLHEFVARKGYSKDFPYKHFPIKKRSGGTRWISVPVSPLWAVQSWITQNILRNVTPHRCSTAYAKGCSPHENASRHCKASWLLKLDIEDFFGHISEKQIFYVFRELNYTPLLSFEMARLCTKIGKHTSGRRWISNQKWIEIGGYYVPKVGCLPQGAPTSPMLSNLVSRGMDEALFSLAKKHRAKYSRYSDDLTFSFLDSNRDAIIEFKAEAVDIIRKSGFTVNANKSKLVPPGARKIVTGLVVNERRPTLQKEYRDRIRSHLYYCQKFGVPAHCKSKGFRSIIGFRNHLEGLIRYAIGIQEDLGKEFLDQFLAIDWGNFEI